LSFLAIAILGAACSNATSSPPSVMFVADRTANQIVRFDGETGAFEGVVAEIDRPSSTRLGPDGALYVAGFGDSNIVRVDPWTGADLGELYRDTAVLEEPVELMFEGPELYVLGHDTHNAIAIEPGGTMIHDVGYPDMRGAHDFVFGPDGLLYVATEHDASTGMAMQVWNVELGDMVARFGTLDQLANATGIALVGNQLYVTDYERGTLVRFDSRCERADVLVDDLAHPISLELGPDGLLYVIDDAGIQRFTIEGDRAGLVVPRGEYLVGPRSLTFVTSDI
jgi:sugar lactone lactonase YvrE